MKKLYIRLNLLFIIKKFKYFILAFILLLLFSSNKSFGQATYTWIGNGGANWTVATNWSPQRNTPAANDILLFSTGTIVSPSNIPTETIGQLKVSSITTVNLRAAAPGTVLTISGGAGDDFTVIASAFFNLDGFTNTITVFLSPGATAKIDGTMQFSNANHRLDGADANSIVFTTGGNFTQQPGCLGNVFGNTGTKNVVVFNTGSFFYQFDGGNPFGFSTLPDSKVVFKTGSYFEYYIPGGTPSFSGRIYANFRFFGSGGATTCTGANAVSIDTFEVRSGTINVNMTATPGHSIKGDITVSAGATLNFNPASAGTINLNGTSPQNITNSGTLTFGTNQDIAVNNAAGLTLKSSIALNKTLTFISGKINIGNNTLTVNNTAAGTIVGQGINSYVVTDGTGVLKRAVTAATNSYDFPVGNSLYYKPATINFTTAPTSAGSLSARFNTGFTAFLNPGGPLLEGALKVNALSIQGTWFIDPDVNLTGGLYTGTFSGNGVIDVIDFAKLVLVKRPTGGGDWVLNGTHVTATGSNATPSVSRTGMSGFSQFGIGGELNIALPIQLNYLNSTKQNNSHNLTWKITCANSRNVTMTLERSADNRNFTGINTIVADALRCQQPFAYTDNVPLAGINYYRLKMTDDNGKTTYSNAIAILNKDAGFEIIGLQPTLVTNDALLNVTAAQKIKMVLVVTDINGRLMKKIICNLMAGSNKLAINLTNLPAGNYQITGFTEDGKLKTIKFVKQ
jgi:hypothetical protein